MTTYELYHDESMEDGYWHGMLLVPIEKKESLLEKLAVVRKNTGYNEPISIKKVREHNRIFSCANSWVHIGFGYLRSRSKNQSFPIEFGQEKGKPIISSLENEAIGAKFILFRERDNHQKMKGYPDSPSKVETTFRFGLKGGLHFLGSDKNPIHIEKMHFDGYKHHLRHLDKKRIVGRLYGLRNYCSISNREDLIDDKSSDHRLKDGVQSYGDCQLLQLTDLLIGSFRTALGVVTRDLHKELSHFPKKLLVDYQKGYVRMRNSRWLHSFWVSECFLEDEGNWRFENMNFLNLQKEEQLYLIEK